MFKITKFTLNVFIRLYSSKIVLRVKKRGFIMTKKPVVVFIVSEVLAFLVGSTLLSKKFIFVSLIIPIIIFFLWYALSKLVYKCKKSSLLICLFGIEVTVFGGFIMCSDKTSELWVIGLVCMIFGLIVSILSFMIKENVEEIKEK